MHTLFIGQETNENLDMTVNQRDWLMSCLSSYTLARRFRLELPVKCSKCWWDSLLLGTKSETFFKHAGLFYRSSKAKKILLASVSCTVVKEIWILWPMSKQKFRFRENNFELDFQIWKFETFESPLLRRFFYSRQCILNCLVSSLEFSSRSASQTKYILNFLVTVCHWTTNESIAPSDWVNDSLAKTLYRRH